MTTLIKLSPLVWLFWAKLFYSWHFQPQYILTQKKIHIHIIPHRLQINDWLEKERPRAHIAITKIQNLILFNLRFYLYCHKILDVGNFNPDNYGEKRVVSC